MNLKFLGTGAAEAVPAVFCECDYCQYAREHKGKDIRTRSSFRINDRVQIDISPDIFMQMVNQNLSMNAVRHLLITHSHSDHLDVNELLQQEFNASDYNVTVAYDGLSIL